MITEEENPFPPDDPGEPIVQQKTETPSKEFPTECMYRLKALAKEKGYKSGYVAVNFRKIFNRWPTYAEGGNPPRRQRSWMNYVWGNEDSDDDPMGFGHPDDFGDN